MFAPLRSTALATRLLPFWQAMTSTRVAQS
jgi:hypothetical protein